MASAGTGIVHYIDGCFEQICINRFTLGFVLCVHNGRHTTLCVVGMIEKAGKPSAEIISYPFNKARKNVDCFPQQGRIRGGMDSTLHVGTILVHSVPYFYFSLFAVAEQLAVNDRPGLIGDGNDVAVQRKFFKPLFGNSDKESCRQGALF